MFFLFVLDSHLKTSQQSCPSYTSLLPVPLAGILVAASVVQLQQAISYIGLIMTITNSQFILLKQYILHH